MNRSKSKIPIITIAVYLIAVVTCIFLAFDFAGAINFNRTLVLIGLTLPLSLVSVVFTWSLIHGAGLEGFAIMYLVFAGINSLIFYWLCPLGRRSKTAKSAIPASANGATEQVIGPERGPHVL